MRFGRRKTQFFLPGGHLESGEIVADTLARELWEELGLTVTGAEPAGMVEHRYEEDGRRRHELNIIFAVTSDQCEFHSREDHLTFHVVPWDELAGQEVRPAALQAALQTWARDFAPFVTTLPGGSR
jgi:8-oxo-dGTP pyrophosphatase MutT (NUDIX family)